MKSLLATALLGAVLTATATAQIQVFGGTATDRGHSTKFFFDGGPLASVCIQYGTPEWKADYEKLLEGGAKGKNFRLGKDYWTTLHTDVPLTIAGTEVAPGAYFLGLTCDDEGTWSLAFMEATKALEHKAMPFFPEKWSIDMTAPLTHTKSDKMAETMSISLDNDQDEPAKMTLTLTWGNHVMTAETIAKLPAAKPADASAKKSDKQD